MTLTFAIKDLPSSSQDVNLDTYGYDGTKWSVTARDQVRLGLQKVTMRLDGASRQFPVIQERLSDQTQKIDNFPATKGSVQVIAPVTQTDSETGLEVRIGACKTWIGFHVTDRDAITPAMVVKQILATLDLLLPTVTGGVADPGVISSLMSGDAEDLG